MKILIGTPIHQIKDYSMERWLMSVAKLRKAYPADFFMVDNSPTPDYVEKVKRYCGKYGITNYKIIHVDIDRSSRLHNHHRMAICNEIIKKRVLTMNYDAWFFWENDVIIPSDTLGKIIHMMTMENFDAVFHNVWRRENPDPDCECFDLGATLIKRGILKNHSFLRTFKAGPDNSTSWIVHDCRFKKSILNQGGTFAEIKGLVGPIYHLNK